MVLKREHASVKIAVGISGATSAVEVGAPPIFAANTTNSTVLLQAVFNNPDAAGLLLPHLSCISVKESLRLLLLPLQKHHG